MGVTEGFLGECSQTASSLHNVYSYMNI